MSEESTTPDLVERVRIIVEAIPRRDWDTCLGFYAPNAVWESAAVGIGRFEGHAAMRGMWEDFTGVYEDLQVDLDEGRDLGSGIVLAVFTIRGRFAAGGGELRERGAWVFEWVDDRIVRVLDDRDPEQGRAAAERLAQERG